MAEGLILLSAGLSTRIRALLLACTLRNSATLPDDAFDSTSRYADGTAVPIPTKPAVVMRSLSPAAALFVPQIIFLCVPLSELP